MALKEIKEYQLLLEKHYKLFFRCFLEGFLCTILQLFLNSNSNLFVLFITLMMILASLSTPSQSMQSIKLTKLFLLKYNNLL